MSVAFGARRTVQCPAPPLSTVWAMSQAPSEPVEKTDVWGFRTMWWHGVGLLDRIRLTSRLQSKVEPHFAILVFI